jgi:hypothetical protein
MTTLLGFWKKKRWKNFEKCEVLYKSSIPHLYCLDQEYFGFCIFFQSLEYLHTHNEISWR